MSCIDTSRRRKSEGSLAGRQLASRHQHIDIGILFTYQEDYQVVIDMKEGQLIPFLAHYNQKGVNEIQDFGQHIHPNEVGGYRLAGIERPAREDGPALFRSR